MSLRNARIAVVLMNFGGPENLNSVQEFLFNLFNDRNIIPFPQPFRALLAKFISSKRSEKLKNIYRQIGGKSVLSDITFAQSYNLEKELSFAGDYKTFVCMRYTKPFARDVVAQVLAYDPSQIILLPLYPQFSTTTSLSSFEAFAKEFGKTKSNVPLKTVCCYPTEPHFILAHSLLVKQTIENVSENNVGRLRLLFSAHGLPQRVVDRGDPYVFQINKSAESIINNLADLLKIDAKEFDYRVCFQSKVGRMAWTKPSLEHEIRRVALDKKIPVIIPISFTSDHSETLFELDIEYKKLAEVLGIEDYLRVPSLNLSGHFTKSLVEICKNISIKSNSDFFSATESVRLCPKSFKQCLNTNQCNEQII